MPIDRRKGERRAENRREAERRKGPELRPAEGVPITQDELNRLRSHLEYEIWMLNETASYLSAHGQRIGEADMNAYLESFLLHASTMVDFFFPPAPGSRRDVIAEDFVPDWSMHVQISSQLVAIREMAGEGLGHLSYRNLELPTKEQLTGVCEELTSLRSQFELMLKIREEQQLPPTSEPDGGAGDEGE